MNKKPVLVFDFDGTLIDSIVLNVSVYNKLAVIWNTKIIAARDVSALKDVHPKDFTKTYGIKWYKLPFILWQGKRLIQKRIDELKFFEGMKSLFIELNCHYQVYILTTNASKNVQNFFLKEGVQFNSDKILSTKRLYGKAKLLSALKLKGDVFYIGDEVRDMEAAKKAQVSSIAVTWGYNSRSMLDKREPNYMADDPKELKLIISDI